MGGKMDIAKGRLKEAAGAIAGNNKLRREGKIDQVVGKAKEAVRKARRAISKRTTSFRQTCD